MDDFLTSSLPWEIKAAVCLACGLVTVVLVILISKRNLAWIGKKTSITPNAITWLRLPVYWLGVVLFFYFSHFWGFELVVFACALDRLDGKMAKAFDEYGIYRSINAKKLGESLDPIIDKLTLLPLIAIFSYKGVVSPWTASGIIAFDIFGTIMRKAVFIWFKKIVEPKISRFLNSRLVRLIKRIRCVISRRMRRSKASAAGKIKALMQSFGLAVCVLYEMNWVVNPTLPNVLFNIALFFGILSVLTRVKLQGDLDKAIDSANAVFSHQDI